MSRGSGKSWTMMLRGRNRGIVSNKLTISLLEWSSIQFTHQNATATFATDLPDVL